MLVKKVEVNFYYYCIRFFLYKKEDMFDPESQKQHRTLDEIFSKNTTQHAKPQSKHTVGLLTVERKYQQHLRNG